MGEGAPVYRRARPSSWGEQPKAIRAYWEKRRV